MAINDDLVLEWQIADAALKIAQERFDKITNELAQDMLVQEIKSDLVCVRGDDYKVTVVQSETVRVDGAGLKQEMGAIKFRKVCAPAKVDKKLLEIAIRDGVVSAERAAEYIQITKSKPFVKVTKVTGDE